MGSLAAWLARWGRVLAGYIAFLAAFALIVTAIDSLLGIHLPTALDSGRLWAKIMEWLGKGFQSVTTMHSRQNSELGDIIIYACAFDGLRDSISWIVACFSAFIATLSNLAVGCFTVLGYQYACRKVSWLGNATAGVKVGD